MHEKVAEPAANRKTDGNSGHLALAALALPRLLQVRMHPHPGNIELLLEASQLLQERFKLGVLPQQPRVIPLPGEHGGKLLPAASDCLLIKLLRDVVRHDVTFACGRRVRHDKKLFALAVLMREQIPLT